MTTPPKVSFLLTAYNFAPYIGQAIESLLAQRGGYHFEIIVVDDCSTDNTPDVVGQVKDDRVRYIQHEQNRGVAGSINHAFSLAQGQYICRFDGDDVWYPWLLEETIPFLDSHPEVGMIYGDIAMINSKGKLTQERCMVEDLSGLDRKSLLKKLLLDYVIPAPAIVARREAWQTALPLADDLIFCDFDLSLNLLSHWKLAHTPKVLAQYRIHDGNIHTTSFTKQRRGEQSIMKSVASLFGRTDILTQAEKNAVLESRYLGFGDSYFGIGSMADARRCYWEGLKISKLRSQLPYWRRFLASFLGGSAYAKAKSISKGAIGKQPVQTAVG